MEVNIEQIGLVTKELDQYRDKYALVLREVAKSKKYVDVFDLLSDVVRDLVIDSTLCCYEPDVSLYSNGRGKVYRIFNGHYYVPIYENVLLAGLRDWLGRCGVSGVLLLKMSLKIREIVSSYCYMKVLKPRLTLMCFGNGVVDFSKPIPGKRVWPALMEFSRDFDVVKEYPFNYDPAALINGARIWKNFLGEPINLKQNEYGVLPEKLKRQQLQMFLGALLADREVDRFEYFMILQGDGANGKSVIFRILCDLFGKDEVSAMDIGQLGRPGDEKLRAAAALEGKRLMFCPEENLRGGTIAFRYIKQLASGETMSARKIGENMHDVYNPPVLMLNTNHKYKASDFLVQEDLKDQSMLRRVQILNFEKTIPVAARDVNLSLKLRGEKAGIFAWIVKGFLMLKKNRFRMPESRQGQIDIILEKARGQIDMNGEMVSGLVLLWVERKKMSPYKTPQSWELQFGSAELYRNFCEFCQQEGLEAVSRQKFGRDLTTMGFVKDRLEGGTKVFFDLFCTDVYISDHFLDHIPNIVDEAECELFEGEDMTEFEDEEHDGVLIDE